MKGDMITLYSPGDGVSPNSNTITYKGIKEFRDNGNGTISFNTKKNGEVLTCLPWRLKKGVELEEEEAAPAVAGNREHVPARNRGW
jgi:hypothetical protein